MPAPSLVFFLFCKNSIRRLDAGYCTCLTASLQKCQTMNGQLWHLQVIWFPTHVLYWMVFYQWPISHSLGSSDNFPTENSGERVLLQLVWMKNKSVQWAWFPNLKPQKKRFRCTRPTCLQWENVWSSSPILNVSFFCIFEQPFHPSVGLLSQTDFLIQGLLSQTLFWSKTQIAIHCFHLLIHCL